VEPGIAQRTPNTRADPRLARTPELLWLAATALISIVVLVADLKLWKMHAHVPIFPVDGDASYYLADVKDVVENGWYWHNANLGAPFGQANFDFADPFGDVVNYAMVWLLGLVLGDPIEVFNAFFLVCFPLIATISFAVMRDLGAARAPALVGALLFVFLPYHLLRNEAHLLLTSYYAIPLLVWLVMCVVEGRTLLHRSAPRRTLAVVAIAAVGGAASDYYAVFGILVLLGVVPIAALARRSRHIALQGAGVLAIVSASFLLCSAPAIIYPLEHGSNTAVAQRAPAESELFGLKLAYMVLPRPGHRLAFMSRRGTIYYDTTPLRSEGFDPALGSVATLGLAAALIILLMTGLAGREVSLRRSRIASAGAIALVSFLIGTVGGISTLIAYEISPQVRAWNRLSLVIAFAALMTVALLLTALGDRLRARGRPAWVLCAIAAVVGVLGLFDQTSPSDAPDYAAVAASWKNDGDFGAAMQRRFPSGTKILQLPYMSYPENGTVVSLRDYDLFKGYFHTTGLHWTYGIVRGRPADWLAQQQSLAPEQLAAAAAAAGFGAVYVDHAGYADGGAAVDAALGKLAGPGSSQTSADGRLQFFDLRPAASRLRDHTTAVERSELAKALLYPIVLGFGHGFSYQENAAGVPFRWAGPDAELTLDDPLPGTRTVRIGAQLFGGGATPSTVTITLPDGTRKTVMVSSQGTTVSFKTHVAHGKRTLRLQTAGPAAPNPPGNIRDLRLRVVGQAISYGPLSGPRIARYVADATP
jgi:phosphoglycerol transferase